MCKKRNLLKNASWKHIWGTAHIGLLNVGKYNNNNIKNMTFWHVGRSMISLGSVYLNGYVNIKIFSEKTPNLREKYVISPD